VDFSSVFGGFGAGHIFFVKCVDLRLRIGYIFAIENLALSHGVAFVIFDFRVMIYD
jgi:hypothetical protein